MRGHIQQRGKKSWRIKRYMGRDETGRKRYAERTVRGTRQDAERELRRLLVEVDQGRFLASSTLTLDELLDRWLAVKRSAVERSTLTSYDWISRSYVRPALGHRKVVSLRPVDLDMVYSDLAARGLSVRTVRICHTVLRQSLEQARRWEIVDRSPAVDASPPPQRREEVTPPTVEHVRRIIAAANDEDPAFGTYLWLKATTGCRRGEMCAIRWTDVDLERAELAVRRSVVQAGRDLLEKDTKTHRSRRLALDETSVEMLRQHRVRQRKEAATHSVRIFDDALLFATPAGQPWRPDVVTNRFGRLRARLGLDHVRLHDLRHFSASVLIDGGIPISTVSTRLGHTQMSTTLNLYTHALPATDQRAAAYIGELLSRRPSHPPAEPDHGEPSKDTLSPTWNFCPMCGTPVAP